MRFIHKIKIPLIYMRPMYLNDDFDLRGLTLRVGTDCSGLDSPIVALNLLGINVVHKWSCDNDPDIKKQILHTFNPEIYFHDMFDRDITSLPDIDLYVCGMPCQSFSIANPQRQGFNIKHGTLFFEAFKVIEHKRPKYFVLENVKGLISHNNGETYAVVREYLSSLEDYTIHYKILNTMDYGVPQNRPRLYIIGIRDADTTKLELPTTYRYNLSHYIDPSLPSDREKCLIPRRKDCLEWAIKNYDINERDDWCINIGASLGSFITAMKDMTPCILTFCPYYYLTKHERFLQPQELLALQGFPNSYQLHSCKSKQYKQIGNAMSVNVLYHVFYRMLS